MSIEHKAEILNDLEQFKDFKERGLDACMFCFRAFEPNVSGEDYVCDMCLYGLTGGQPWDTEYTKSIVGKWWRYLFLGEA
jgi:hypothetical protein